MGLLSHAGSFGTATRTALRVPVLLEHALCDLHASHLRFLPRLHRPVWLSHLWWVKPDPYWYHQLPPIGVWPRWGSLKLLDEIAFPSLVTVLSSRRIRSNYSFDSPHDGLIGTSALSWP